MILRLDTIPIYIDERALEVYYVSAEPVRGYGYMATRPYLIGSTTSWGAFFAVNLAAAYMPEGLPCPVSLS